MTVEYHLAVSPGNDEEERNMKPAVLFVRGWVRGPLTYLQNGVIYDGNYIVVEPDYLPMPPWPLRGFWWWDRNFLLMFAIFLLSLWKYYLFAKQNILISSSTGNNSIVNLFVLLVLPGIFAYWIRLMSAVVCRSAISKCVESCLKELRRHNVVLVVAFSWGAAVVSELLTRQNVIDEQPAILLIAPTTARVAQAGMTTDAAERVYIHYDDNTDEERNDKSSSLVHIVHATDDKIFCPYPERWEQQQQNNAGSRNRIELHVLPDSHLFQERASKRALAGIVANLLRARTTTGYTVTNDTSWIGASARSEEVQLKRPPIRTGSEHSSSNNNNV